MTNWWIGVTGSGVPFGNAGASTTGNGSVNSRIGAGASSSNGSGRAADRNHVTRQRSTRKHLQESLEM